MKKLILILFLIILGLQGKSQTVDTLDYIDHYGTIFPVLNKNTLSNVELKILVRDYPEALKDFRKARLIRHTEVAVSILSLVPLVYAIESTTPLQFWIGIGLSGLISGASHVLLKDPYNRRMRRAIKTYNRLKLEEVKKLN